MAHKKETIGKRLDKLRKAYKKRDNATGMLYNNAASLKRRYRKITMYGVFVSDENTFMLRPHIFEISESKPARTPQQWSDWLSEHYGSILPNILAGMSNRTGGKFWRIYRVVGWTAGHASTGTVHTAKRKKRNKTIAKRNKNGRSNTRGR